MTCSDSRVCPEIIFDCGVGDIFTICVAGNIVDLSVKASVEYACIHLGVDLVMVMGHQNCGAVAAALNNEDTGLHLDALLAHIRPAIADVDENPSQDLNLCAKRNALNSIKRLEECELTLGELGREQIRYQAAFYYLDEGRVELLTPLPRP